VIIRDSREEADRVHAAMFEHNGGARRWTDQPIGTPEDVAERLAPYLDLGYHHFVAGFPSPYDEESMTRFATEVGPLLGRSA
jgi:alkanesulfonate monooxygenase SsuD/methylene tetrahydromethanopterin reductase-like flavin-dependent oxidoreductase (luciferase family)